MGLIESLHVSLAGLIESLQVSLTGLIESLQPLDLGLQRLFTSLHPLDFCPQQAHLLHKGGRVHGRGGVLALTRCSSRPGHLGSGRVGVRLAGI